MPYRADQPSRITKGDVIGFVNINGKKNGTHSVPSDLDAFVMQTNEHRQKSDVVLER